MPGAETNKIRARAKRNDSLKNCRVFFFLKKINYVFFHKMRKVEDKEASQKVALLLVANR